MQESLSKRHKNLIFLWLRPSSSIESRQRLRQIIQSFRRFSEENIANLLPEKLEKYKNAQIQSTYGYSSCEYSKEHPKVPEVEQIMSTAAAAENILMALHALGYGEFGEQVALHLTKKLVSSWVLERVKM